VTRKITITEADKSFVVSELNPPLPPVHPGSATSVAEEEHAPDKFERFAESIGQLAGSTVYGGVLGLALGRAAAREVERPIDDALDIARAKVARALGTASRAELMIVQTTATLPLVVASAVTKLMTWSATAATTLAGFAYGASVEIAQRVFPSLFDSGRTVTTEVLNEDAGHERPGASSSSSSSSRSHAADLVDDL